MKRRYRRRLTPGLRLRRDAWLNELEREIYLGVRDLLKDRGSPSPHDRALRCAKGAMLSIDHGGLRVDEVAEALGISRRTVEYDRDLVEQVLARGADARFRGAFGHAIIHRDEVVLTGEQIEARGER